MVDFNRVDLSVVRQCELLQIHRKGRAIDNIFIERLWKGVKYECVYLHAFEEGEKLYEGLQKYFYCYNNKRIRQSLDYTILGSKY